MRDPATESFPALIARKLRDAGRQTDAVNAGLSGDTTAGGLSRLDYWLGGPVDVFVLELGINDLFRGVSPQTILVNLGKIMQRVREKHPACRIALMGMQVPESMGGAFVSRFIGIYDDAAKMADAFVPFFLDGVAGNRALNLPDQLHPNAAGYERIAEHAWPAIQSLL